MEELRNAIIKAFDANSIRLLVRDEFNINLDKIVIQPDNLDVLVDRLLVWCQQHGKVGELLLAAVRKNPDNRELKRYVTLRLEARLEPNDKLQEGGAPPGPTLPLILPARTGWRKWLPDWRPWRLWIVIAGVAIAAAALGAWAGHILLPRHLQPPELSMKVFANWADHSADLSEQERTEMRDLEKTNNVRAIGLVLKSKAADRVFIEEVEISSCLSGMIKNWRAHVQRADGGREELFASWKPGAEPIQCHHFGFAGGDRLCVLVGLVKNEKTDVLLEQKVSSCLFQIKGVK